MPFPDGIKTVGVGLVTIKGRLLPSETTANIDAKSTIDIPSSGVMKNLKATAQNMRYPVHSDFGGPEIIQYIENCSFIHYGNKEVYDYRVANGGLTTDIWEATSAWGCGTPAGGIVKLFNCYMESTMRAFSTHNNANYNTTSGASFVEVKNCTMISKGVSSNGAAQLFKPAIFIQHLASFTDDVVNLENNNVVGDLVLQTSSGDWREFTQRLTGFGNGHLMQVRNTAGGSKAFNDQTNTRNIFNVKVSSNNTSEIIVSGNLKDAIMLNYSTLKGSVGLNSYVKAKLNVNTAYANVNAYSGAKSITFTAG